MKLAIFHKPVRPQTRGEELANTISHGVAFVLALISLPVLVYSVSQPGRALNVAAAAIFSVTMMGIYLISAMFHACPDGRMKEWLNRLDHAAIYLFIAGSYTPFLVGVLRGNLGWILMGVIWGLAAVGVAVKLLDRLKHPFWSTALYVGMGWLMLVVIRPLSQRMDSAGIVWLVAGGASYTAGALVFLFDTRMRFAHFIWHLFVMGGSACHFCAVLWHAL
jgi:hemolysin III